MRIPKTQLYLCVMLSLLLFIPLASQARTVKGIVFHDLNKNLKLDDGEPGIPGVLVSNQQDVVKTDKNGEYKMSVNSSCILFITKPAGYMTPVDENNLPQFYYVHQETALPNYKFSTMDITGQLPKRINFPLFKTEESDTFEVLVFGDPQPRDRKEISYVRDDVAAETIGTSAKFGIALGDLMFDDLSLFEYYNQVVAQIGIPFYNVPGNHDRNYDAPTDELSLETFKKAYGPPYYSFNYGKVHFIVLDDVLHFIDEEGKAKYKGGLDEQQLYWLEQDIGNVDPDHLIVFTIHIPFAWIDREGQFELLVENMDDLFKIIQDRNHLLALSGHMHMIQHNYIGKSLGFEGENPFHHMVCATVSGSWWSGPKDDRGIPISEMRDGAPNGYHVFRFEGNQYSEKFYPAFHDDDFQMRIHSPRDTVALEYVSETQVIVNVFDGGEHSEVFYQIDGLAPQPMGRTAMKDPFFLEMYNRFKDEVPNWLQPDVSSHIWTAPMFSELEPGVHKIVVTTVDQFGQKFSAARIFEIR